jgi:hypothetical protein
VPNQNLRLRANLEVMVLRLPYLTYTHVSNKTMRTILQILTLYFLVIPILGQDCSYDATFKMLNYDISDIWLNETYQGTIGANNQRIERRIIICKNI